MSMHKNFCSIDENPSLKSDMFLEIFDKNDNSTKTYAPREDVHLSKQIHRHVFLFIWIDDDMFLITRRGNSTALYKNYWTSSVSGHPEPFENPHDAIIRETNEELGIKLEMNDIKYIGKHFTSTYYEKAFNYLYTTQISLDKLGLVFDSKEISDMDIMSIEDIIYENKHNKKAFTPGFLSVVHIYINYLNDIGIKSINNPPYSGS